MGEAVMRPGPSDLPPRPQGPGVYKGGSFPTSVGRQDGNNVSISVVGDFDGGERMIPTKVKAANKSPTSANRTRINGNVRFCDRKYAARAERGDAFSAGFNFMRRIPLDDG